MSTKTAAFSTRQWLWLLVLGLTLSAAAGCLRGQAPPASQEAATPTPVAGQVPAPTETAAPILPEDALATFFQEGGVACMPKTLTVKLDGTLSLVQLIGGTQGEWPAPVAKLTELQQLLESPDFVGLPATTGQVMCSDCFEYTITARTPEGIKRVYTNEAAEIPPAFEQAIGLLLALRQSRPR